MNPVFQTPADILNYLWLKHTGHVQFMEPKTLLKKSRKSNSGQKNRWTKEDLKLRYSRVQCRQVALWLNELDLPVEKSCEIMHPKRGIWVRVIRALRLSEYARKKGFDKLKELLDKFYKEDYFVWQGAVDKNRTAFKETETLQLLKERPDAFARALFANMLWFDAGKVMKAFENVSDKVPEQQISLLNACAKTYFNRTGKRVVKPIGSYTKTIATNRLTKSYADVELERMQQMIADLCSKVIKKDKRMK